MAAREQMGINIQPSMIDRVAAGLKYMIQGVGPENWFGPMQPIQPQAQDKAAGRQFDYPVGYNLRIQPRSEETIGFSALRGMAESYDLMRLVIETRKDQVAAYEWEIIPKNKDDSANQYKKDIIAATDFLQQPDRENDWAEWLRLMVEDMLVINAICICPRQNRGGKLYSLDLVDGGTIKRLLDDDGRTPILPSPAYQQILKGITAVDYTTEELIYMVRNKRTWKIYGYCYDELTEILTSSRGWVSFDSLTDEDVVATRSPTGEFQWQKPSRIVREQWDGYMYHFYSRSMDMMVTPEHRMLVDSLPKTLGGNKTRKGDAIITAQELAEHGNSMIKIPVTSNWIGDELGDVFFEEPRKKTLNLSGDDFCALLGAYLAEGNIRSAGGIEVAQLESSKGYVIYKELFDRIGGSYNGRAFVLSLGAVTEFFREFGHAHEKFIPQSILNATPRQLAIFWDYYIAGDGCHEARPNISGRGNHPESAESATTVSKRLADGLVEVAQKLGFSASVTIMPACEQKFDIGGKVYVSNCRESYKIRCRYSKAMSVSSEKVHYIGGIYCVTVPNGIVYVRRNGKPAWAGNSPVEQVIMTVNIALRRQMSQLPFYTEGQYPGGNCSTTKGLAGTAGQGLPRHGGTA